MYRKNFQSSKNSANKKPNLRLSHQKVNTAKGRKTSSTQWIQRQINDPYVILKEQDGYRSRAIYKLKEIDEKYKLISRLKHGIILDLGAAPGSWSQYAVEQIHSSHLKKNNENITQIIAVDLQEVAPMHNLITLQGDFLDVETQDKIIALTKNNKVDLILSDMAPNSCGHKDADHLKLVTLCEEILEFSHKFLVKNGNIICKLLRGSQDQELLQLFRKYFDNIKTFKPKASRNNSREIFLIALNYNKTP